MKGAKVLVLGITFKENCPDLRNSKVIDVVRELNTYGITVDVVDPQASEEEVAHEYQLPLTNYPVFMQNAKSEYSAIILAVSHKEFLAMDVRQRLLPEGVLYDVKSVLPLDWVDGRL